MGRWSSSLFHLRSPNLTETGRLVAVDLRKAPTFDLIIEKRAAARLSAVAAPPFWLPLVSPSGISAFRPGAPKPQTNIPHLAYLRGLAEKERKFIGERTKAGLVEPITLRMRNQFEAARIRCA